MGGHIDEHLCPLQLLPIHNTHGSSAGQKERRSRQHWWENWGLERVNDFPCWVMPRPAPQHESTWLPLEPTHPPLGRRQHRIGKDLRLWDWSPGHNCVDVGKPFFWALVSYLKWVPWFLPCQPHRIIVRKWRVQAWKCLSGVRHCPCVLCSALCYHCGYNTVVVMMWVL